MRDPFNVETVEKMQLPGAARRGVKRGLKMADDMAAQAGRDMRLNAATGKTKVRRVARPAQNVAGQPR